MKTARFTLISIVVLGILIGQSNSALARTNGSIGVGVGFPGFYGGYHAGPYGYPHSALARTNVSMGVGVGFRGFYGGYRAGPYGYPHNYRCWGPGRDGRYNYPYGRTIIVSGGYYYDWWPDYYVADQPVIESTR